MPSVGLRYHRGSFMKICLLQWPRLDQGTQLNSRAQAARSSCEISRLGLPIARKVRHWALTAIGYVAPDDILTM